MIEATHELRSIVEKLPHLIEMVCGDAPQKNAPFHAGRGNNAVIGLRGQHVGARENDSSTYEERIKHVNTFETAPGAFPVRGAPAAD